MRKRRIRKIMAKARLMNTPEDYKKVGVKQDRIEMWEDGIRITPDRMNWEWWYFDTMLDGGIKVVIQFFSKSGGAMYFKNYHPKFTIRITLPDGSEFDRSPSFSRKDASWSKDQCDVHYGPHFFTGDLKDYAIHVEPIDGLGADLKLHSLAKPYRPGSSYIEFGAENRHYTWFCAVPTGEVTGTITVNGKEQPVHGYGYHDHQWGNVNFLQEWNHWVWARQKFEDCSLLIFDMVSNEKTEYTRFPFMFIQDIQGNLLFENTENVECQVLEDYKDTASGKIYPKAIHYRFENGGKMAEYTLKMQEIIECNGKNNLPPAKRLLTKAAGIDPAYTRYTAEGTLILRDSQGERRRSGGLIYEFMYPGSTYKNHM